MSNQNDLYRLPASQHGYHGPKADELDLEEEADDKVYVEEEYNFVHRRNIQYPVLILHAHYAKEESQTYSSDNPQETQEVDARIDQMLKECGLDMLSDDESIDSEYEQEAENIEIREKIEEMKRIVSVATLFQEKVMLVDKLHQFAKDIGVKRTIEHILGFLIPEIIKKEKPNVKKALIPQFMKLTKYLISSNEGYNAVVTDLVQHYTVFLLDQNAEIAKKACESLLSVSNLITKEDRSTYILPIILELAHDNELEDSRCMALQLLSHFVSLVEKDYAERIIVNEIISLSDDPVLNVRRTTVVFLVNICKFVSTTIFESKLFPLYYKLSYDNVWGVRKAAVEILPDISMIASPQIRSQHLVELYKKFTQDASKWVKMAAHQYLGPFIATLKDQQIDKSLVNYYISMGDPRRSSFNSDVAFHCAYNFPAVLLTLGKEKWSDLKRLYKILVKDNQWKVRKTLAYSLHEIAKILGPELTEEELLPVLENFLKDSDEIRNGVLIHLADFIRILDPMHREKCISMLGHIQSESNHWRLRKLLASQLKDCVELFDPKVVYKIHFPIAFKLCQDDVAEVRDKACCNIPVILQTLKKDKNKKHFDRVKKEIFKLGDSDTYVKRQVFIAICSNILNEDLGMFCKYFIDKFLEKQSDRVINVRIIMAKYCGQFLSNFVEPDLTDVTSETSDAQEEEKIEPVETNIQKNKLKYEKLLHEKKFMRTIIRLKNDQKPDVGYLITKHVNFDRLMELIKQGKHKFEDVNILEGYSDTDEEEEDVEVTNEDSELQLDTAISIWSINSTRSIIDDVISSTDEEGSADDD